MTINASPGGELGIPTEEELAEIQKAEAENAVRHFVEQLDIDWARRASRPRSSTLPSGQLTDINQQLAPYVRDPKARYPADATLADQNRLARPIVDPTSQPPLVNYLQNPASPAAQFSSEIPEELRHTIAELRELEVMIGVTEGYDPFRTPLTARRLHRFLKENPWANELKNQEMEKLIAISDPLTFLATPNTFLEDVRLGLDDQLNEVLARNRATNVITNSIETQRLGQGTVSELTAESMDRLLNEFGVEPGVPVNFQMVGRKVIDNYHPSDVARDFLTDFEHSGAATMDFAYDPDSNRVVGIADYEDGAQRTIDVRVADGTVIDDTEDALYEIAMAKAGLRGEVVHDDLRGREPLGIYRAAGDWFDRFNAPLNFVVGWTNKALLSAINPYGGAGYQVDARSTYEQQQEQIDEEVKLQVESAQNRFDTTQVAILAAQQLLASGEDDMVLAASAGLGFVDSMSEAELDDFRKDITDAEQLEEWFRNNREDRSSLRQFIDDQLNSIGNSLNAFDGFVQRFGVGVLSQLDAALGLIPGVNGFGNGPDLGEGFERFSNAWAEASDAQDVKTYFGLDGWAASVAHFTSSVLFDPFTWVTPGGRGLTNQAKWQTATREGAENLWRSAPFKNRVYDIADALDNQQWTNFLALTDGMNIHDRVRLLAGQFDGDLLGAVDDALRNSHATRRGVDMMQFGSHVETRGSYLKLNSMFDAFGARPTNSIGQELAYTMAQLPGDTVVRLGPHAFVDEASEWVVARFAADQTSDRANQWVMRFLQASDEAFSPTPTVLTRISTRIDDLTNQLNDLVGSVDLDVKAVNQTIKNTESELARRTGMLDELVDAGDADLIARTERLIEQSQQRLDFNRQLVADNQQYFDDVAKLDHKLNQARRDLSRVQANMGRESEGLYNVMDEFLEDWAEELGVPTKVVNGQTVRDWQKVTGRNPSGAVRAEADSAIELWARRADGTIDEDLAATLSKQGAGQRHTLWQAPVSPAEMIAYARLKDKPLLLRMVQDNAMAQTIGKALDFGNQVFATAALASPAVAARSHLEEILRFVQVRGFGGGGRNSIIGVTAWGDEPIRGTISSVLGTGAAPLTRGRGIKSDYGLSTLRDKIEPYNAASKQSYSGTVRPGKKGYTEAAARQINGIMLGDPVNAAAFRHLDDYDTFKTWWDDQGEAAWKYKDGKPVQASTREVFESRKKVFDALIEFAAPSNREGLARALRRAAADGGGLTDRELRMLGNPMPTSGTKPTNALAQGRDWFFENVYGMPGAYRAAGFQQIIMDDVMESLLEAKAGRILNEGWLAEKTGMSVDNAAEWLANAPSWQTDMLLDYYGLTTNQQLWDSAYRIARRKTRNAMYEVGARSAFGQKARRIYPFGSAQFDFVGFQLNEASRAMELGLNPSIRGALDKVPGIRRAVQPDVPFLGRNVTPSVRLGGRYRTIPFNLRLAARYGEVAGFAQSEVERYLEENPNAAERDFRATGALAAIENATFIPTRSADYLLDLGPGLGPWPSTFLRMLPHPDDAPDGVLTDLAEAVRKYAEELHPALGFDDRQVKWDSPASLASAVGDFFLPRYGGNVGGLTTEATQWIAAAMAPDAASLTTQEIAENYQNTNAALQQFGRPNGFNRVYKSTMGEVFADNGGPFVNGSDEMVRAMVDGFTRSWKATAEADGKKAASYWGGQWTVDTFDGEYVQHYDGLMENLTLYQELGLIGDSQVANLRKEWDRIEAGDFDRESARSFVNQAHGLLTSLPDLERDLLLVAHPQTVSNIVGSYQCKIVGGRPVNEEYCGTGRLELPPGNDGLEIWRDGRSEGWIEDKPPAQVQIEMNNALSSAHRRVQDFLWKHITGIDRPNSYAKPPQTTTVVVGGRERKMKVRDGVWEPDEYALTLAEQLGIPLQARMTGQELGQAIDFRRDQLAANVGDFSKNIQSGVAELKRTAAATFSDIDNQLVLGFEQVLKDVDVFMEDHDLDGYEQMPQEFRSALDGVVDVLIGNQLISAEEYNRWFSGKYGPHNWEFDAPPASEAELEMTMDVTDRRWEVVDGDTIRVYGETGPYRVRIIGVNAADFNSLNPEVNDQAHQQTEALEALLRSANSISFGVYRPEKYGSTQEVDSETGEVRFKMWLYVDGEPIYDPDVFTFRNPTGVSSTGRGVPSRASDGEAL